MRSYLHLTSSRRTELTSVQTRLESILKFLFHLTAKRSVFVLDLKEWEDLEVPTGALAYVAFNLQHLIFLLLDVLSIYSHSVSKFCRSIPCLSDVFFAATAADDYVDEVGAFTGHRRLEFESVAAFLEDVMITCVDVFTAFASWFPTSLCHWLSS